MSDIYALWQNPGGDVTFKKIGATRIENQYGLDLYLYHSKENYDGGCWWYVVERDSGAAFARGKTGPEAVDSMMNVVIERGLTAILNDIRSSIMLHGAAPDRISAEIDVRYGNDKVETKGEYNAVQ